MIHLIADSVSNGGATYGQVPAGYINTALAAATIGILAFFMRYFIKRIDNNVDATAALRETVAVLKNTVDTLKETVDKLPALHPDRN